MTDAFAPNVDEFMNFVQKQQDDAVRRAIPTEETDPDKASRAIELSDYTGLHPSLVRGNLDNVEGQFRSQLTNRLVERNKYLQEYINHHPLASEISNDDWGNLDTVSNHVQTIGTQSTFSKVVDYYRKLDRTASERNAAVGDAFMEGFGREGLGAWIPQKEKEELAGSWQGRLNHALFVLLGSPLEVPLRTFTGLTHTIGYGAEQTAKSFGADDEEAKRHGARVEEFIGVGMAHGMAAGLKLPPELNAIARNAQRSAKAIKPYIDAGVEPPLGVDPAIDQVKAGQAKLDADNLKEALAQAQKSNTRERNPEMFRNFIRQHTDAEIGIPEEIVRKLYGDSVPMPDDGLLGWVPGIEDQLIGTGHHGGDIKIPLADWLAHVEPEVAKALHDNIRVRGNGLTLEEAKNLKPVEMDEELFQPPGIEAKSEMEQLRARLDGDQRKPMFQQEVERTVKSVEDSVGLGPATKLKRVSQGTGPFKDVHDFDFVDADGKSVGDIQITDNGKDLVVEYVRHNTGPQAFGPRAIRDIARQLKEAFPEAKTISGIRVSGAREQVAKEKLTEEAKRRAAMSGRSVVSEYNDLTLDVGDTVTVPLRQAADLFHDLVEPSSRVDKAGVFTDYEGVKHEPTTLLTENEKKIAQAVDDTFTKLAPRLVETRAARRIKTEAGGRAYGVFADFKSRAPLIMWALESPDAVGTARHEIIHHLRRTGFLSREEWSTLRNAAVTEGWIQKYNIGSRYKGAGLGLQIEEAVAEHFAHWNRNEYVKGMQEPPGGFQAVLYKISQLYHGLRESIRGALGFEADWKDLFTKIEKGEVGSRRGVEPLAPDAFRGPTYQRPPEQGELDVTRIEDKDLFAKANAIGMTVKSYKKYLDLMEKKDLEDTEFAKKQNLKNVERRQTQEWKEAEKKTREAVRPDYENRPDLAADKFLREGVLFGDKIKGRPRLNSDKLTAEQKAMLPEDFHTAGGMHPDDVANLFGYDSGDTLVNKLVELHQNREASKLSPARYLSKLVDDEIERRMRTEHGDLAQNILDETQEHVISQTQFDMLHEETLALATKAEMEMSLTKEDMKAMAKEGFAKLKLAQVKVEELLRNALRANELAERALLDGDPKEAFRQKQKQLFSFLYAREAKALEKEQKKFNRLVKTYTQRTPSGREPEYTNYIHEIMQRFGIAVNRTPQDVATEIGALGHGDLEKFIESKNSDYGALWVDERLYDPAFKPKVSEMNTEEFRAVNDAMISLDKASRDEKKVTREGAKEDLAKLVDEGITQLETFPLKTHSLTKGMFHKVTDLGRQYMTVGILNAETWLNRWDRDNVRGLFNQWLVRPLTTAANREAKLGREFSKLYRDLGEVKDGDKLLPTPLIDPLSITRNDPDGRPYTGFTRKKLAAVISNAGNEYNWDVLTKGHNADPGTTLQWVINNSTKEDWVRAEKMGKIFQRAFEMAQDVYRNIYGVAPPKIELKPFHIQFPNGETFASDGWYHPVVKDPDRTNFIRSARGEDLLEKDRGLFPSIANGYTKRRTGAIDVLSLDHDMVVPRLNQILHDVSFRQEIIEAAKLVKDKELRKAIRQYYGPHYVSMLDNWLADTAGATNIQTGLMSIVSRASNYVRTNVIGSLIGFNPGTVLKHGPTAAVNSMYEVGLKEFSKAFVDASFPHFREATSQLFFGEEATAERINRFIEDNSEEIQRRDRNWQETIGGAAKIIEGKSTWRDKIIYYGSKPVAYSDLVSARPTWLAAYMKEFEENGVHGDAVFAGDRAVRRAHGSTAVTNLPELVRSAGPFGSWLTTLYGFFSTQMQRRAEIAFQLNDNFKLAREGEIKAAATNLTTKTVPLVFAAIIWPTIVEEYVTSIGTDDRRGWGQKAAFAAITGVASSFLYFRDFAHGVVTGQEPSIGMASTPAHTFANVFKDMIHPQKALDRAHAAKTVSDFITAFGEVTGMAPAQLAKVVRFGTGYALGTEHPKGPADVAVGLMRGTAKRRVER